jgi:hypothetical protein
MDNSSRLKGVADKAKRNLEDWSKKYKGHLKGFPRVEFQGKPEEFYKN